MCSAMLYKDYIQGLRDKFIGAVVYYDGEKHTVVDVDYNGALLIDKPARFTDTTAVSAVDPKLRFTLVVQD